MIPALLALAGCAPEIRVLDALAYRRTDPDTGLSSDLHVEGAEVRARDVRSQCSAELREGDLARLYRRAAPLFDAPPADAVSCDRCEQAWLSLDAIEGETVEVRWSGELDEAHDALARLVDDLDGLWANTLEHGDCGGAPFTL